MKYQVVYQEHEDAYGNWLVRNERGEYAAAPVGVQGVKKRRWHSADLAASFMDTRAALCGDLVWLSESTRYQAKPGQPSMHHRTHVPANGYKPAHGDYCGTVTGRTSSFSPTFQEVPRRGVVNKFVDGNEEASTIPDTLTGNLPPEPMSLGDLLRSILQR